MKKLVLVALLVMGMACATLSAKAAPQGGSQVTVTNNGQPASGVSFVLDISNRGKTANSTSTTDSQGSPNNVLDLSNVGKVKVDVYVEVCQNGQHIVIVDAGMTPPDDGSCNKRRKIGGFWLTGSDTIKIDIGTGTVTATSNGAASSSGSSSSYPRFEIFGGYSLLRVSSGGQGYNYNGGTGSIDVNVTSHVGIVGDFGGYYRGESDGSTRVVSALVGPKVFWDVSHFTPFAHAMFGGSTVKDKSCTPLSHGGFSCGSDTESAVTFGVGGGLDWNATTNLGIRLIQIDDVITKFGSQTQNNARISVGATIRW